MIQFNFETDHKTIFDNLLEFELVKIIIFSF